MSDHLFNDKAKIVALEQVTSNLEEPFVKILEILFDDFVTNMLIMWKQNLEFVELNIF